MATSVWQRFARVDMVLQKNPPLICNSAEDSSSVLCQANRPHLQPPFTEPCLVVVNLWFWDPQDAMQ